MGWRFSCFTEIPGLPRSTSCCGVRGRIAWPPPALNGGADLRTNKTVRQESAHDLSDLAMAIRRACALSAPCLARRPACQADLESLDLEGCSEMLGDAWRCSEMLGDALRCLISLGEARDEVVQTSSPPPSTVRTSLGTVFGTLRRRCMARCAVLRWLDEDVHANRNWTVRANNSLDGDAQRGRWSFRPKGGNKRFGHLNLKYFWRRIHEALRIVDFNLRTSGMWSSIIKNFRPNLTVK